MKKPLGIDVGGPKKEMKKQLYEVIKALSAMRLCKEDNIPDAILCRRIGGGNDDIPFVPAKPKTEDAVSEIANDVPEESRGEPCLFQGSIGTAYNLRAL